MLHRKPRDLRMTLGLNGAIQPHLICQKETHMCCVNSWCIFLKVDLEFLNFTDNSCHGNVACNMPLLSVCINNYHVKKNPAAKSNILNL